MFVSFLLWHFTDREPQVPAGEACSLHLSELPRCLSKQRSITGSVLISCKTLVGSPIQLREEQLLGG